MFVGHYFEVVIIFATLLQSFFCKIFGYYNFSCIFTSQLKHKGNKMTITKFNKQFKAIKSQLVYGDIKQISIIAGMERETVSRFINEKGDNINTAIKVLNAAYDFLSQREKMIS